VQGGSAGRGSGVNFAIPIDKVVATVPNLISSGNAGGKRIWPRDINTRQAAT